MSKFGKICSGLIFCALPVCVALAVDRPVRMVDEGGADKDWAPAGGTPLVQAPYPKLAAAKDDVCISIGYKINRDGSTSDLTLLKAWSSATPEAEPNADAVGPFAQSAAAAVTMWRFEAKPDASSNRVVYTVASIPFVGEKGTAAESVREHCRITDLRAFIAKMQNDANRRGNLSKEQYERSQREFTPMDQAVRDAAARASRAPGP